MMSEDDNECWEEIDMEGSIHHIFEGTISVSFWANMKENQYKFLNSICSINISLEQNVCIT
jgi:hypothetical protein